MTPLLQDESAAPIKIFCVGLPKTGTYTLGLCLKMLGFTVSRPRKKLLPDLRAGRIEPLADFFATHDAYRGPPVYLAYREAYRLHGQRARFILTLRRDAATWVRSLKGHILQRGPLQNLANRGIYGRLYPHGQERHYERRYEEHRAAIRDFLAGEGAVQQLLEVCWENGDGWEKLCPFLGRQIPDVPIPHSNRGRELKRKPVNEAINRGLMRGYERAFGHGSHELDE
jgi:hypothetical protein